MKRFLFPLLLTAVVVPAMAQRVVSGFTEKVIHRGESCEIGGVERELPDIYYTPNDDGTFFATRLTVQPETRNKWAKDVGIPYLSTPTPNSICVCWKTKRTAEGSVVRYGSSADRLDKTIVPEQTQLSSTYYWQIATIDGLEPDTYYYYQVESNGETSEVGRFRTLPEVSTTETMRILVVGDHQRNEHSDYEWLLSAAHQKANEKWGEAPVEEHFRFIMNVGDQIDSETLANYEQHHFFKSRTISPVLPTMTAVGNHEYKSVWNGAYDGDITLYERHYPQYASLAYKGIVSGKPEYYAMQAGAVLFVVLDSDKTTAEQKTWVRRVAAAAASDAKVKFIVAVNHRPLFAEQWCYDVSPWARDEIMPILSATGKLVLDLSGHHHLYARGQRNDAPFYHIITGGGVGTSQEGYEQLWGTTPDNRDEQEVQKTLDHWTYQIAEFDPVTETMTVECYSIGNSRLALDNELVDRFSICLSDRTAPATPEILPKDGDVALPCEFRQKELGEGIHSVEYQVSRTADFREIVLDRIVTFENCYGADADFRPLDLNKDVDLAAMPIENGLLNNGRNYIRVRNRNMNLVWSEYSEPVEFNVVGAADRVELSANGSFFRTGSTVSISYTAAPVGTEAWIGIYREWEEPGQADSYRWAYTDGANGEASFRIDDKNAYYAVLFKDGGYSAIGERAYFVVGDNCDADHRPAIATDKFVYSQGEQIGVTVSNTVGHAKDWVGIYDHDVQNVKSAKSHTYKYLPAQAESAVVLNTPDCYNWNAGDGQTDPAADGFYFVAYCLNDAYYEAAPRALLVVGRPVIAELDNAEAYEQGAAVVVSHSDIPAWVEPRYVVETEEGTAIVDAPVDASAPIFAVNTEGLAPARYSLAIAAKDGTKISAPQTFTVKEKTPSDIASLASTSLPVAVYSPSGARVLTPSLSPGLYIVKVGEKSRKMLVK